eukprot:TRINITY_DN28964_c0_g1_i1.p1 TRINITY_DN28964_c0_g1~~TRINITY_DN28964_c0_g1_i1.p1  ORF type:complete len:659 (-),score=105.04 TRINITY_DN28964_c0_g1_i1:235-2211(-)
MAARCLLLATALQASISHACTIVAVGKDASATGAPMVTHSDDSGPTTTDIRFVRVPRRRWEKGSMRPLYVWQIPYPRVVSSKLKTPEYEAVQGQKESIPIGEIPQVEETWAYWDTDYGIQNEWGLSIGESTATANTVGWPATPDKPYGYCKAGIEDLSKIALERCKTARCAVQTMGEIAVEQGFYSTDSGEPTAPQYSGSSEALVVADADPGELWIFNVLTGKNNASAIWAAQKVPSDHVVGVGNSFTIRRLDLNDPENSLYSPGVTKLAEEMGWWNPYYAEAPGVFDFFAAYGYQPINGGFSWDPPGIENILAFYSGRRMWRIFSLLSPEEGAKLDPNKGNLPKTVDPYPPSVKAPKGSVTREMVMKVKRDHYEGTPYDLTKGMAAGAFGNPNRGKTPVGLKGQWERAISMFRTSFSFIAEARPRRRSIVWFGYDSAHGTVWLPFYGAATEPAPSTHTTGLQSKFDQKSGFWAFNLVNQYADKNFRVINAEVLAKSNEFEQEAFQQIELWEKEADDVLRFRGDYTPEVQEDASLALLTRRSNDFAEAKVADWWNFAWHLIAKYGRYVVTYNESVVDGTDALGQAYPEWWLSSPDVGFTSWQADGPFIGVPDESGFLTPTSLLLSSGGVIAAASLYYAGVRQGRLEAEELTSKYQELP